MLSTCVATYQGQTAGSPLSSSDLLRFRVKQFLVSRWSDMLIGLVIVANSITIGVEMSLELEGHNTAALHVLESLWMSIYILELGTRIFAMGPTVCSGARGGHHLRRKSMRRRAHAPLLVMASSMCAMSFAAKSGRRAVAGSSLPLAPGSSPLSPSVATVGLVAAVEEVHCVARSLQRTTPGYEAREDWPAHRVALG